MCRYVAYVGEPLQLSEILYKPANGLVHQASDAMESRTRINADGFGIGWYDAGATTGPAVFKDISPAWNNLNLRSLATSVSARCVLAHVRAAQRFDPISRSNCHPFQNGRLLWMHNGDIPGRARFHRRVVAMASDDLVARLAGNTDSELAFTLFLTLLGETGTSSGSADELADAMTRTVQRVLGWYRGDGEDRPLAMNFCVTNGEALVALRYAHNSLEIPTLHVCRGSRFVCEDGVCRMRDGGADRCVILASEALSEDSHWTSIDNGTLVVVRDPGTVELRELGVRA
jgi:glutamine amidotransferase